jgi:hypothetical protein
MTSTIVRASPAAAKTSVRNADARYRRRSTRQRDKTPRQDTAKRTAAHLHLSPRQRGRMFFAPIDDVKQRRAFLKASFIILAARFAPELFFTLSEKAPHTHGRRFHVLPRTREAERRTAHPVPTAAPDERGTAAGLFLFSSRLWGRLGGGPLAFRRSAAVVTAGPRFLGLPGANGRTLPGASAASTSQSGHAPDGTLPKPPARQERRTPPAGTAPAPSVGVTGDVPHDEQDAALMQSERKPSRIIFLTRS